jgi:hypothetical protein
MLAIYAQPPPPTDYPGTPAPLTSAQRQFVQTQWGANPYNYNLPGAIGPYPYTGAPIWCKSFFTGPAGMQMMKMVPCPPGWPYIYKDQY